MLWVRGSRRIACTAVDVNLHAFFLGNTKEIAPGSLMQLIVTLPSRTFSIYATARFVGRTTAGHGIGAELFNVDRKGRSAWTAHYRVLLAHAPGRCG